MQNILESSRSIDYSINDKYTNKKDDKEVDFVLEKPEFVFSLYQIEDLTIKNLDISKTSISSLQYIDKSQNITSLNIDNLQIIKLNG